MAIYAIGDVQGCALTLQRLIDRIHFDPARDRLWFVGDLVNRGPRSLETLRFVRSLGAAATLVLGNHELRLLEAAAGAGKPLRGDALVPILRASDREELLDFVWGWPLLHHEPPYVLVHAGLLPAWTVPEALRLAEEIRVAIMSLRPYEFFDFLRPGPATVWQDSLSEGRRLATALFGFTRLRTCTEEGVMDLAYNGPPHSAPPGQKPWFELGERRSRDAVIVFGHWAALGLCLRDDVMGIDSGCVYGNALTALRLSDRRVFQEPCAD